MSQNTTPEEQNMFEAECDAEYWEYERSFPNIGFTLSIRRDELDDELSNLDKIIIKNDKQVCGCQVCESYGYTTCDFCGGYDVSTLPETDYIEVKKRTGQEFITVRDVVNKLNDIHYEPQFPKMFNPSFLEDIYPSVGSTVQFQLAFGS